jgi:hypothetical protein
MPEWLAVVAMVFAVPLVAILAIAGVAGMAIWVWHRSKMAKLQIEEKERQAEADRELLGLGSQGISAHIDAILERLNSIEGRLARIDGSAAGQTGGVVRMAEERRRAEGTVGQG